MHFRMMFAGGDFDACRVLSGMIADTHSQNEGMIFGA